MNESIPPALFKVTRLTHWTARIFSLVVLVSWGPILNSIYGGHSAGTIGLIIMAIWLLGLAVAWENELLGALSVIAASFICVLFEPRLLLSPVLLVMTTALLFLTSHLMRRTLREDVLQRGLAL